MQREIVELEDGLLREAKHVAAQNDTTLNEAIAVALRQWVETHRKHNCISIIGMVNVPTAWTQEELDRELMDGLDPYEGWSPNGATADEESSSDRGRQR